jgi:hypothetical protein
VQAVVGVCLQVELRLYHIGLQVHSQRTQLIARHTMYTTERLVVQADVSKAVR